VTDVDVACWSAELDRLHARIGGRFTRSEPRRRARQYVSGLVAGLDRTNGWTLAEQAGDSSPDGMQRLLRRADWDVDTVRDDVREYVIEHLGDPQGVLIIDDTGFLKKGVKSAGVARQYSGTAGRIENCQVGVFMAYRSSRGHALIDRQLYLPQAWTDDRDRCRQAGIPDEVEFATKVEMARTMLARAFAAGVPARLGDDGRGLRSVEVVAGLDGRTRPAARGRDPPQRRCGHHQHGLRPGRQADRRAAGSGLVKDFLRGRCSRTA
jgi:SRSO17 transposase